MVIECECRLNIELSQRSQLAATKPRHGVPPPTG
jgi:hypothetical protein